MVFLMPVVFRKSRIVIENEFPGPREYIYGIYSRKQMSIQRFLYLLLFFTSDRVELAADTPEINSQSPNAFRLATLSFAQIDDYLIV